MFRSFIVALCFIFSLLAVPSNAVAAEPVSKVQTQSAVKLFDDEDPLNKITTCAGEQRDDRTYYAQGGDGEVKTVQSLWYQKCRTTTGIERNRVNGFRVVATITDKPTFFGHWKEFRVNPNIIGNWNPVEQKKPINGAYSGDINVPTTFTWGSGQDAETWVRKSAPENERCISIFFEVVINVTANWDIKHPSICMDFFA